MPPPADDLAVEVNDDPFRDLVEVRRLPTSDRFDAFHLPLPRLHHHPRLGAELPVHPVQRLVQHQSPQPFRRMCRVGEQLGHPLPRQGDLDRVGVLHDAHSFQVWADIRFTPAVQGVPQREGQVGSGA
ncbi:hypothetical protein [Nonomuraea salmonea]|uniref:hypothetical protein n=1 Tax=Nonomuraea salmonea TaxID=46181 RepID=UPI0031EEA480